MIITKNRIISYPKCGRTWIRVILGKIICNKIGLDDKKMFCREFHTKQILHVSHDLPFFGKVRDVDLDLDILQNLTSNNYKRKLKRIYSFNKNNCNILFLIRDPRDVVISDYFHLFYRTRKIKNFNILKFCNCMKKMKEINISNFICSEYGVKRIIFYYLLWDKVKNLIDNFLIIRYEDLHKNIYKEIKKILKFFHYFNFNDISEKEIKEAIQFGSFENMKKLEKQNYFIGRKSPLKGGKYVRDKRRRKVREGRIGNYIKYLNKSDIIYINRKMMKLHCPFYQV